MRGTVSRLAPWDVPVDLFFYRDPEELEKAEEAQAFAAEQEQAQTWNASAGEAAPKEQPYSDPNAMAGFEQAPAATGGFAAPAAPERGGTRTPRRPGRRRSSGGPGGGPRAGRTRGRRVCVVRARLARGRGVRSRRWRQAVRRGVPPLASRSPGPTPAGLESGGGLAALIAC